MLKGLPKLPGQLDSHFLLCPILGCLDEPRGLVFSCGCFQKEPSMLWLYSQGPACYRLGGEFYAAGPCYGSQAAPGAGGGDRAGKIYPSLTARAQVGQCQGGDPRPDFAGGKQTT